MRQLLPIIDNNFYIKGILDAINVPGFALGSTMIGFSVIAKEAGFDIWMVLVTTATVWGMPGQVAFASLYAVGSSLVLIFIAVTLANMRMMLMVISGANILKIKRYNLPFWKKAILLHVMAITSWAQIGYIKDKIDKEKLLNYYIGFSFTIFTFGILGTFIGFYINNYVSNDLIRIFIFLTPLYILLLITNSKENINKISVIFGGLISIALYPLLGNWCILFSGLLGGSSAILINTLKKRTT